MGFDSGQIAAAALASKIGGGITSAIGSYYSAQAQKSALKFNARMADRQAESVLQQGQQEVASLTMKAGQVKGAQRAAMAANGIDLGMGSAAEVQASTDIMKTIDMNAIESNAMRSALGFRADALLTKAAASAISPVGESFSTLLTGAGAVADYWYRLSEVKS